MRKPITLTGWSFVRFIRYWWIHTLQYLRYRCDTPPFSLAEKSTRAVTFILIQKHVERAAAALPLNKFFSIRRSRSRSWLKHAMAFFSMRTEIVTYESSWDMRDTYRYIVVCERIASASRKIQKAAKAAPTSIPLEHWNEKVFLKRASHARICLWRCSTND